MKSLSLNLICVFSFFVCVSAQIFYDENAQYKKACLFTNSQTNSTYQSAWEETFKSLYWDEEWTIENDQQNEASNVVQSNGYLALNVRNRTNDNLVQFTGAKLTSKKSFSNGRFEVRAAIPVDKSLKVCIRAVCHQQRQIDIACSDAEERLSHFGGSYEQMNKYLMNQIQQFHLFGFESNDENELRFFIDDQYEKSIKAEKDVCKSFQIQMQISSTNSKSINSKCPVLIVDYVKIYKPINTTFVNLPNCTKSTKSEDAFDDRNALKDNCSPSSLPDEFSQKGKSDFYFTNWIVNVLLVTFVVFAMLL